MNIKNIKYIRYGVQGLGILLTIIGFFTNFPIVNSILLGLLIVMGPVFCGWICPFGTLQDVFSKLGSQLGIKKFVMPSKVKKVLAFSRYILLIITIFISADFIFNILSLDPRANFTTLLGGKTLIIAGFVVIFIFALSSMFFERPFCNYICIEGAKFGLLSAARPVTIVRNEETCVGCSKCNRVCPMNIDVASHGQVRSLQCINCMECVAACPAKNTLKVGVIPVKKTVKKTVLTFALAAFVLVVYTGVKPDFIFNVLASNKTSSSSTVVTGEIAASYGDAEGIEDGVYEGTGTGFRGEMKVKVTVQNQQITSIEVTETNDDSKWFDRAYSTIATDIIKNQTAEVNSVSGATYSSMGIKEGVANALINAGGENVEAIENNMPAEGEQQHGGKGVRDGKSRQ
ncbi:FMN-binding domain-containing protein [Clostridium sartagoforme AAU1]|uniref:FMN-binding domain-containing protein n=1 Tax=Clostridium sartagoforme AAU1 TaxID=1202534 RepID=R9CAM5_9CLOT|nr:FMN-binding protein [Clostridium sartagoforme]EOR26342.1 FMN-binding domain-containing protein [Clostridium sartagoforme AAU1]